MHAMPTGRRHRRFSACFAVRLAALPLAAALLLSGCADDPAGTHPHYTAAQIADFCLARLKQHDGPASLDALQPRQWGDYVSCRVAMTVLTRYAPPADASNPEAIVSVSFLRSGTVESADVTETTGETAWHTEVVQALHDIEPLPPLPASARIHRIRLSVRYPRQTRSPTVPALQDESHWSLHECVTVGGVAKSCN
ncbi:TonB C-terminal domain-containing protein [Burkholderia sp. Ac-20379]|uniref:TonB C-terminal domain-containing protein n=1 Tax=Burkholderia sp. Ac-20379 TaxID=2703900 RepID=UPI00197D6835|nr:TonB C-terminal domain-containing protein [Burkholderia sp. Ac-20379]MBN3724709.1 TonB C-terminal domain-containing protein [Burkholderia sp. Ac-20379]